MILSQAEAAAVYRAMVELNNVSAYIDAKTRNGRVVEYANGSVWVSGYAQASENYVSQNEFANAYGLLEVA